MIAIAIDLILFFTKVSLPAIVTKTLDFCAGLNTPLAMFAVGVYLAQCSFVNMLISVACPVGSNLAVYAQLHDKDYTYAMEAVAASTLFCIITIPLLVQLEGCYGASDQPCLLLP